MITEAIILAGGLGTRLRETVPDLPKCMAPVAGRPFLYHVINYLRMQGISDFIFSLGFRHERVQQYLEDHFSTLRYRCVVEHEPLGTGGAIKLACTQAASDQVLVVNGDTLFRADIEKMAALHTSRDADCTLALKPMKDFDRYGVVSTDAEGAVTGFKEKKHYTRGDINGGIYLLNRRRFLQESWPEKFSFEKDYLEIPGHRFFGFPQDVYFIDIGIPEDFERAQQELTRSPLSLSQIDNTWSLFLDRDGVINKDKEGSYIFHPDEFVFVEGAPGLFRILSGKFGHVIVVTNQRGVGRGLMSEADLTAIHLKMTTAIHAAGGLVDDIYYCTSVHNDDPLRKPNPGMIRQAVLEHPEIDLGKAIIVGNNLSDMRTGRSAGIYTVFVRSTRPNQEFPHPDIDLIVESLQDFCRELTKGS